ncbi:hypothetical protein CNMCM5793_006506 [Aspergillus hiratsukae]|uniref:Fungal N-terminal domain-containing protein n=1 Tax=Aspergillus hiratsukae TaxID=1194566 RepID=A0A8H6PGW6_9EURO|nr:hypothetical protein CNMCM5793_006506 [Aspergillus hiratsukae]KAF7173067.1 hypothetical protein CNMCM6106_007194 [Aspergillus hiratsukae]
MAETIGLIASLVSIAGAGLTLAQKLHDYGAGVASSGKRTQEIAFHVRSTATVVEEVANIFKEEGSARRNLISHKAIETVEDVVKQCSAQFDQLNQVLENTANGGGLGKLLFPLRESRLVLLQSNLERLKMTLQCFMQVIIYARLKAEKNDDDQSQRMLIQELILLRKQAAGRYERNKIKAQEEDEREPSGPSLPDSNRIPSEMQLSAGEPTTKCLDEEDKDAPALIAANTKPPICTHDLDSAADSGEVETTIRRHSRSIRSEQIHHMADSGGAQTGKRVRSESIATSLKDCTIATGPVQDHARTGLDGESPELARAWDDLVHAIDQLVHALAVACCCCCAKRKNKTAMVPTVVPASYSSMEFDVERIWGRSPELSDASIPSAGNSHERQSSSPPLRPVPRSGASDSIHLGALPNQEEVMYVAASYEVDELLDLWTNLNQESSSTTDEKIEE